MRDRRWPALRWGGLCGGAAVALVGLHEVLTNTVLPANTLAVGLLTEAVFSLLCLPLFFAAGALAARETDRVSRGTLAGLFAALIAGVSNLLLGVFDTLRQPGVGTPPPGVKIAPGLYRMELLAITIGALLVVLVIFLAFGAGFGALGGVAGRPMFPAPPTYAGTPTQVAGEASENASENASDLGTAAPAATPVNGGEAAGR